MSVRPICYGTFGDEPDSDEYIAIGEVQMTKHLRIIHPTVCDTRLFDTAEASFHTLLYCQECFVQDFDRRPHQGTPAIPTKPLWHSQFLDLPLLCLLLLYLLI